MISLRARFVRYLSRQIFKRISPDSDVMQLRESFESTQGRRRAAAHVQRHDSTVEGIDCEWLVPDGCEDAPVLYYLHGGAYLMGSPRTHRNMVSHIARAARVRALLPEYSLAPENPFPAGVDDCVSVYRGLLRSGIDASDVVIAGDSAGGGLCMASLLTLRASAEQMPAAAVLLSPWLDLTGSGDSMRTRARADPWFKPEEMYRVAAMYCPDGELGRPLVSPVFADAGGLPPVLIQVGDHEILLSDSIRLADNISEAGGKVTLQVWPEMWHVFQFFVGQMPESKRAIGDIASFIGDHVVA